MSDSVAASPIHARDLAARIDALPASAGLWRFIILLSLGGFFELYDLFQTGYISTGLIADGIFHTGAQGVFGVSDQAAFASATFLGLFVGASLLSPYADRFGRRATFMFALIWYGAFSLLLAFQQQAEWVIFLRFLVGVGLGIELVTIDTYLTEWVPAHLRTRAFAFAFFVQFLSVPAVALMSWWLVPQTIWGLSGWRYVVIAGALASLVIWLVRKGLPESPRWLVQQRRYAQARQVMRDMERRCGVAATDFPSRPADDAEGAPLHGRFRDIWAPQYRDRTLMLVVMNFFQAIGFFGFGNWLPALLSGKGASVTHSLLYAFFITLAYPLGSLLCSFYADKMENKWQIDRHHAAQRQPRRCGLQLRSAEGLSDAVSAKAVRRQIPARLGDAQPAAQPAAGQHAETAAADRSTTAKKTAAKSWASWGARASVAAFSMPSTARIFKSGRWGPRIISSISAAAGGCRRW